MSRRVEWALLALILAIGAWLRFSRLDLLEFQADEAYAANLALDFVRHGKLPEAGLMSSVGVTNPPLFIYLLIPMFAINSSPVFVSGCIALLGLGAVAMTWHIGRKYYGSVAGLVAAAFFAVSPWAVIYSRKIWAQDFVPVFATATMWAVHAVVLGKKPKAIFWCVLLPLCVVQIHFSGLALTAAVVVILAWLRPKMDWKFAVAGLVAAIVLMIPYLRLQSATGWADFKQARQAMGGGQQWEQLRGITTHPITGYRLPSKQHLSYALAIMNAGRIEDVLGIAAGKEFDRANVWAGRGRKYFESAVDWVMLVQRIAFVAALVWAAVLAVKARMKSAEAILILWLVVPVAVFFVTGLWTYLTYFVILYPAHFLVLGAPGGRALPAKVVAAVAAVFVAASVVYMAEYYRFVEANGGAQGTFGTALGHKIEAAKFLAERGEPVLELNHAGQTEAPQLEWPFLISQWPAGAKGSGTVVLLDGNRAAAFPAQAPDTNFGPIRLYFVKQ